MALLALVAPLRARATISLSSLVDVSGVPVGGVLDLQARGFARELWCAWGSLDMGKDIAMWPFSERICLIPRRDSPLIETLRLTVAIPSRAQRGNVLRFFLFDADQSYDVSCLIATGAQCIDTGICPDPTMSVSADIEMEESSNNQCVYGVYANPFVVAATVNASECWAWTCRNNSMISKSTDVAVEPWRTELLLDVPNDLFSVSMNGRTFKKVDLAVAGATHTQTSTVSLSIFAQKKPDGSYVNFMKNARLYGARVKTDAVGEHVYVPYVQESVPGLKDISTGSFLAQAPGCSAFGVGGRKNGANAEGVSDVVLLARRRAGDVWSDVRYLWNFDTDLDGDGRVAPYEIRNAIQFGSAESREANGWTVYDASRSVANLKGPTWRQTTVDFPARGVSRIGARCLDLPVNMKVDNNGARTNLWLNGLTSSSAPCITGSVTVVARLLVRNFAYSNLVNSVAIFLNNGYAFQSGVGEEFGFFPVDSSRKTGAQGYPYVLHGKYDNGQYAQATIKMETNRWYDVAMSVNALGDGRCQVIFGVADALDGNMTGTVFQTVTKNTGFFTNAPSASASSRPIVIGGEALGGWTAIGNKSSAAHAFNGSIQRIALWPRALSKEEIVEAFLNHPPLFRIGTENDSSGEFGQVRDTEEAYDADSDLWHHFRGTLSKDFDTVTVNFSLPGDSHLVPYVLRIKSTLASGRALLMPYVNDQRLGSKMVERGGVKVWYIEPSLLRPGTSTLRIVWKDGSANMPFAFDVVEMAGSAAVGMLDGSNAEFSQPGRAQNNVWTGVWNWQRYPREVSGGSATTANKRSCFINFWVPPVLAMDYQFRYRGTITGQTGSTSGNRPFSVFMNDEQFFGTEGTTNGTVVDRTFEAGELRPGWNTVRWTADGAEDYTIGFDCHRFEVIDRPHHTILIFR